MLFKEDKYFFSNCEKLDRGLSDDEKYHVSKDGKSYLLRISDAKKYDEKQKDFKVLKLISKVTDAVPKPIAFGTMSNGNQVYMLIEWVEGEELEEKISSIASEEQYQLGLKAGNVLRQIHSVDYKADNVPWADKYFAVIDERLAFFIKEDIDFPGKKTILDFLNNNRSLLMNRKQTILHGDYHLGNMLITANNQIKIIDWQTIDFDNYGDPWYEFNRLNLDYPDFASGMIAGYFANDIPNAFWQLLAYYLAASAITSICWAKYCAPKEYDNIMALNYKVLKDFSKFQDFVPIWYKK